MGTREINWNNHKGFPLFDHEVRRVLEVNSVNIVRPFTRSTSDLDGSPIDTATWDQLQFDRAWVDGFSLESKIRFPYLQVPRECPEENDRYVHRVRPKPIREDIFWVKEAWKPQDPKLRGACYYRSDRRHLSLIDMFRAGISVGNNRLYPDGPGKNVSQWKSAASMPCWSARILLEIRAVSIYRIQPSPQRIFRYRVNDIYPSRKSADVVMDSDTGPVSFDEIFWNRKYPNCRFGSNRWVYSMECVRLFDSTLPWEE